LVPGQYIGLDAAGVHRGGEGVAGSAIREGISRQIVLDVCAGPAREVVVVEGLGSRGKSADPTLRSKANASVRRNRQHAHEDGGRACAVEAVARDSATGRLVEQVEPRTSGSGESVVGDVNVGRCEIREKRRRTGSYRFDNPLRDLFPTHHRPPRCPEPCSQSSKRRYLLRGRGF